MDQFDESRIKEIATRVLDAPIERAGLSANDLLAPEESALLGLQIELAIAQIVEVMRRTTSQTIIPAGYSGDPPSIR
jgi:hypothetical protein